MTAIDQALASFWQHHEALRVALALVLGSAGIVIAAWQQREVWRHGR